MIKMPSIKSSHIVKIAVELENSIPQLIEFDQRSPLTTIIQDLCKNWGISENNDFSLK